MQLTFQLSARIESRSFFQVTLEVCNWYRRAECRFQLENVMDLRPELFNFIPRPKPSKTSIPYKGKLKISSTGIFEKSLKALTLHLNPTLCGVAARSKILETVRLEYGTFFYFLCFREPCF